MKGISIRQPFAGLIIAGIKTVENRTWKPRTRLGRMAIVSTAKPESAAAWQAAREKCRRLGKEFPESLCSINSAILGTVVFNSTIWRGYMQQIHTDHLTIDPGLLMDWWNDDIIGWILEKPLRLQHPIPYRGQLGLYTIPAEIEKQVNSDLTSF